ncbi:FMN-binding protein [Paenibacillus sp. KN14-4R]|uniref:FMN-binding protein n=1 Tax=Paenibacillus sp. KN14-4R TaxID=3445773 RepID=UPI003F9EC953
MAKMNKKWITLCTAAIGAIYTTGYLITEPQANALLAHSSQQAQSTQMSQIKAIYKNGTFTGTGNNRRGSIQVTVAIKNDKITDVEISHFAMHYSESDVIGLPNEVLQKQSALVNNVSGATYSTEAFQNAIKDALSQALNS